VDLEGDLLDAAGACVIPGLVDAHTHPVFAGSRADEFAERVSGASYHAQQSGERGIARTVRATREPDTTTLIELASARANRFLAAQLAPGEGPDIAAELGASSADHLEFATTAQIQALAKAGTVAVLCPGANFTTHGPRPPIEAMREAKLSIAIASDLNPGTSNSESLPLAMSLACVEWGMTPAEVLAGATLHAAHSLKLDGLAGCLRPGSFADCILVDA